MTQPRPWIRFGCIAFRSKLEDGAVFLSIERFCAVEGYGKELAKLWVDEDYRTNAVRG
jgi:hypothetical protein